ncbi:MAG: hypothetical protein AAFO75_03765 [Pseudomonadota bacterium]
MAGVFYAHRLLKMLDELVIAAGMTVSLSDAGTDINLAQQYEMIAANVKAKGINVTLHTVEGANVLTFAPR